MTPSHLVHLCVHRAITITYYYCLQFVHCVNVFDAEAAEVESSQPPDWTSVAKKLEVEDIIKFLESKDVLEKCVDVFKEWDIDGIQLLQMANDIKGHETWELMEIKLPTRAKIKAHFIDYCTEGNIVD